jgi:alpha-1,2-mannosyltransferase
MDAAEALDPIPATAAARWRLAAGRAVTHSLLVWPPVAVGWVLLIGLRKHALAFDFEHAYLPAAHAVLAGHSPYPPATIAAFAPRTAFIYPPLTAYLAVPFAWMTPLVADALVSAAAIALVAATFWLLGVRDWRCYTIAFLWVPTYSAIQTGNVTILLAAGLALLWRHRNRPGVAALITGALIALKLFLWPALLWLLVTRRFRAAAGAAVAGAVLIVAPWAGIGFAGLGGYPHLLSVLTKAERGDSYTIPALASAAGWRTADVLGVAVGVAVLLWAAKVSRRDERQAFALTVGGLLLLTPIVYMHYFLLLGVPLALYKPRFGWAWAVPLLFWVGPQVGNGATWQTAAVLTVAAATFAVATRAQPPRATG